MGKTTKHSVVYDGESRTLLCGNKVITKSPVPCWWEIASCPFCGMYISTHGRTPETKTVIEAMSYQSSMEA